VGCMSRADGQWKEKKGRKDPGAGVEEESEMATRAHKRSEAEHNRRDMGGWLSLSEPYNVMFKLTELALLPHNLSLPQLHLLAVLKEAGGILTTGEIGRAMVKASQTITGLVDRLELQELVERKFDRSDRRKTWIRLTAKGERKWDEALPVANRLAEEILSILTERELRELQTKSARLRTAAMERLTEALGRPSS
jgi:DNA-binding MarR family transcriptional regulator